MVKIKQFNSLSLTFFIQPAPIYYSRMLFCSISSCIEAKYMHNCIKVIVNKSNGSFTFEFENSLDFEGTYVAF